MSAIEIIRTLDGSFTLMNHELKETYHSLNGAMTESLHVYIKNGLQKFISASNEIHILEIGLGTGLNALLTIDHIPDGKTIYYTALEPFPIEFEMAKKYFEQFEIQPTSIHHLEKIFKGGNEFQKLQDNFYFRNSMTPILELTIQELEKTYNTNYKYFTGFNIVYYDAFGPQKQPEMWLIEPLRQAIKFLSLGGLMSTYCAQGQFRRNLKSLEMKVEAIPGPLGKREITIAYK